MGFGIARAKLARNKAKIMQLENELMNSNAETLEAQRAYVALESGLKDESIPVISMKINAGKDKDKASK
jgi:hypothetical protein